jgi:hypothetical protein
MGLAGNWLTQARTLSVTSELDPYDHPRYHLALTVHLGSFAEALTTPICILYPVSSLPLLHDATVFQHIGEAHKIVFCLTYILILLFNGDIIKLTCAGKLGFTICEMFTLAYILSHYTEECRGMRSGITTQPPMGDPNETKMQLD